MASPQPNIYAKYSKELLRAKMKVRIGGVQNQLFECIVYLTYGQVPPEKTTPYDPGAISEMTGLSKVAISKAKISLVEMGMIRVVTKKGNITKNGNDLQVEYVGIQKNYEKWTPLPKKVTLPKMVTNVTKNGNETGPHHYIEKNTPYSPPKKIKKKKPEFNKSTINILEHYLSTVNPPKRHIKKTPSMNNIKKWEKKYTPDELMTAADNYNKIKNPDYIKGPSNFYGVKGESAGFFTDYLPGEFDPTYVIDTSPACQMTPEDHERRIYGD